MLHRLAGNRQSMVVSTQAEDRHTLTYFVDQVVYQLDRGSGACTRETHVGRLGDAQFEPLLIDAFVRNSIVSWPLVHTMLDRCSPILTFFSS